MAIKALHIKHSNSIVATLACKGTVCGRFYGFLSAKYGHTINIPWAYIAKVWAWIGNAMAPIAKIRVWIGNETAYFGNPTTHFAKVRAWFGNLKAYFGNPTAYLAKIWAWIGNLKAYTGDITAYSAKIWAQSGNRFYWFIRLALHSNYISYPFNCKASYKQINNDTQYSTQKSYLIRWILFLRLVGSPNTTQAGR